MRTTGQGIRHPARFAGSLLVAGLLAWAPGPVRAAGPSGGQKAGDQKAKYYFRISEVEAEKDVASAARAALLKDLAIRPEFTSDVGPAASDDDLFAELKKRALQGFVLSLRIERMGREIKPPRPGARHKQLVVEVKVSLFGTTLPGETLAFGGEGEAALEAGVSESRMEPESRVLLEEVLAAAIKQAVDQAVFKLSIPKATPKKSSPAKGKTLPKKQKEKDKR